MDLLSASASVSPSNSECGSVIEVSVYCRRRRRDQVWICSQNQRRCRRLLLKRASASKTMVIEDEDCCVDARIVRLMLAVRMDVRKKG